MPENRCHECGNLTVFKSKPDVLKLADSCCVGDGHRRCKPCSEFATLQGRVQEVEQTLLDLRAAQQSLISIINFHHSSFIRNIPNEVVRLIFSFCPGLSPPLPRGNKEFPTRRFCTLTLGAVCKKWREIAWTMPELWSVLRIPDVPEGSDPTFSLQVELAKEWLGRSANLPLRISLETRTLSRNPKFNPHVRELIQVVNSYSRRWQCLDICVPKVYLHLFCNHPSETTQNDPGRLQHLRLDGYRLDTKTQILFNMDGEPPKPTKVTLGPFYLRCVAIHWGNVTSLTCHALFMDECLELIRLAPEILEFAVGIRAGQDNFPIPQSPITHSHLRELTIVHGDDIRLDFLFSKITLPSLDWFRYEVSKELRMPVNSFIQFLVRSDPPLRHLSMIRAWMDGQIFIDLMSHVPHLEEIKILEGKVARPPYINHFLQTLAETSTPSQASSGLSLLPHLRSLEYKYQGRETLAFRYIPAIFGQRAKSADNATGTKPSDDAPRRPMQSLTITIEPTARRVLEAELPHPSKATVEYLLKLIESEGKTIDISHSGFDLLRPRNAIVLEDSEPDGYLSYV